jgi:mycofactocin system FadH/OYE family oxidoreductase 1
MQPLNGEAGLLDPVSLAGRVAPSRVLFGPHETNLGRARALSDGHLSYYRRRAAGGAGVIVTETASVHALDWPYERAPLAADCGPGWRQIAAACQREGALLLAGLGHAGLQGSSAYSQRELWGPSGFTDVISRETPMVMEQAEIAAVIDGFAAAARQAAEAGADGVEIDAGPGALLRQFHSGLTNQRPDAYGTDKLAVTRAVLAAVRAALGPELILALRLSCDELAPWAGITPDIAAAQARALAPGLDLLTVVRGGPYSAGAYRPDGHTPPMFNLSLAARVRAAAGGGPLVALQGSVVDVAAAAAALRGGAADLVEMTRAQIADAELVAKLRAGQPERIRPCTLCNQACRVRDPRNPVVTCIGDPASGFESNEAPGAGARAPRRPEVLVVGGGPAGLEAARVAAGLGHAVTLAERSGRLGGVLRAAAAGPGRERMPLLADWLEAECRRLGVWLRTGTEIGVPELDAAAAGGTRVILATGSRAAHRFDGALDALDLLRADLPELPAGPVVVHDPVGGPVGVAVAERLAAAGRDVTIVAPDPVIGPQLSRTGDLADASARLQRAGVARERHARLRAVAGGIVLHDIWTGAERSIGCAVLVDCGHRLPDEELSRQRPALSAGDCVAPRTVHEAVLEGRRAALACAEPSLAP